MNTIMNKIKKMLFSLFCIILLFIMFINIIPNNINIIKNNEFNTQLKHELLENIGDYDSNKIVLKGTNKELATKIAQRLNAKLRITNDGSFATLTLRNGETILDVVSNKHNSDIIKYFSIDYEAKISEIIENNEEVDEHFLQINKPRYNVNDPDYDKQTYLDYINLNNVWSHTKGRNITVAVIDTGIDYDHEEFEGKISEYSYNATEDKIVKDYKDANGNYDWSLIEDEQGHGTAVTGVIAASMNNGIGITGIAPDVTIITIKAECNEDGTFKNTSDLVFGLYYAIERDVDVVNMSFGGSSIINPYEEATKLAVDSDIICVASAGNDSSAQLTYPAADPNVIGVGALKEDSFELADYSNYGENVNVVAPGTVYTTLKDNEYGTMNGTSFSSPIVASIIALQMYKDRYDSTYKEFNKKTELLYASCYDLGDKGCDFYFGYGVVDVNAFLLSERLTVTFNYLTDEIDETKQLFIKNRPLQNIPEPERNYAVFDGWYYDIYYTEEYQLYEDSWSDDLTLYCNWVNEDDGVPYTYVELDDGTIEIRSYTGKRRYITIPDYIDEKEVSSIGRSAFSNQTRLRVINLPSKLKSIKDNAFENCTNLTSITIPDTVETIGKYSFSNNIRLYNANFTSNSKLTLIESFAFQNCSNLNRFDIPVNVNKVDGTSFLGCANLKQINANKNSNYFNSTNGVLFNKSKTTLIVYPAGKLEDTYDLPTTVNKLGVYSFAFSKIKTIDLKNVTSIEDYVFTYSKIEKIDIKDGVTSLGTGAFSYSNIQDITLGHGLKEIASLCFTNTYNLKEIIIPNCILEIKEKSFSNSRLEIVDFEEKSSLISIGDSSFTYTYIKEISIPNNVLYIGSSAFSSPALQKVNINDTSNLVSIGSYAFSETKIKEINLPTKLETIDDFAFFNTLLKEVNIPSSVINYSPNAFASCHELENIYINDNNQNYIDIDGVVYTKDLKTIYEYPAGKTNTKYSILENIETIGEYSFYGAHNLSSIKIPEGVTKIDEYGFYDCINITSYNLPTSLEEIQERAFSNNISLSSIRIPDNVTLISQYVFLGNMKMNNVYWGNNPKINRLSFSSFANCGIRTFTVPSNVSSISQYVFSGCNNLSSITFKENSKLESISAYMFTGCNNLETITFEKESKLMSIQAHAFEGMDKLKIIDFGDAKITNIDNYAFRYCKSLQSINIPEGVKEIGRFAFYGCSSLSEITIPESIEFIGSNAFYKTNNINIYFKSPILPLGLQENWDEGIQGYYVGVKEVYANGDFEIAKLTNDTIAIIKYNGSEEVLDLTKLNIGEITQIGGSSFRGSSVKEIVLPNTIKTIERYSFAYSSIESIIVPDSVVQINEYAFISTPLNNITFGNNSNLEKIGKYAFSYCDNLTSITIPCKVSQMGTYAFLKSGLKNVDFNENINLTEINEGVFQGTKLNKVTIPNSVTLINNSAFRDISTLKEVEFNNNKLQLMSNVFYNTGLEKVYIPSTLEYIGEYSLVGLESLKEFIVDSNNPYYASRDGVLYSKDLKKLIAYPGGKEGSFIIPKHVEVIGFGAFENSKLTEVTFEEGINLLTLGYRAFYNLKLLKEITIPESVVSIDYYAFAMCKSLETVNFDINSKLTGIYEGAFYGCINLKNITIPDEVFEISDYAFCGCLNLDYLPISESSKLLGIYDYAFSNSGIEELIFPENLLEIGSYAFYGSDIQVASIISNNKERLIIGLGAFSECDNLTEITIPFIGASLDDNELGWFGYIFGAGSYKANSTYVPESLEKVIITEGQTIISDYAFYGLNSIEEIQMPSTIKYLGRDCMEDCNAEYELINAIEPINGTTLSQNMIGNGITGELKIGDNVECIGKRAFYNCTLLKKIIISEGVKKIGESAFWYCTSLVNIIIPNSITTIEQETFYYCTSLSNITIPNSVKKIDTDAFKGCDTLIKVENNSELVFTIGSDDNGCVVKNAKVIIDKYGNKIFANEINDFEIIEYNDFRFIRELGQYTLVAYIGEEETITLPLNIFGKEYKIKEIIGVTNVIIPEGITKIDDYAFAYCKTLKSISIPSSVNKIGEHAFFGCSSLQNVIILANIQTIEENTFGACISLANIKLPQSIRNIGHSAFEGCKSLKEFEIPSEVKRIGDRAFYHCSSLQTIIIPDSVIDIGEYAFSYCNSLVDIKLPKNITCIWSYTFQNCSALENIIIPEGVELISQSAFYGCKSLKNIMIPQTVHTIGASAFFQCDLLQFQIANNNPYLYYNDGIIYNNDKTKIIYIFESVTTITLPESITMIKSSMFKDCISLTNIIIPKTVTQISSCAFEGCISLKTIVIPDGVTRIDYCAFKDCTSLESIVIPESVNYIGSSAFHDCSSLINITIPKSVTNINDSTFSGCTSLKNVHILGNVKSIGKNAFSSCKSLVNFNIPESVEVINDRAFYFDESLIQITIPNNVTNIGVDAFRYCDKLKEITNNSELVFTMGSDDNGCIAKNANVIIDKYGNKVFRDEINDFEIIEYNDFQFIKELGKYTLVAYIGEEETITLPLDIYGNKYEIEKIKGVINVIIPEGITEIDDYAFASCKTLKSVSIPSSVNYIDNYAFFHCTSLQNVIIPENVTTIGMYAFYYCKEFTKVVIPEKIEYIGDYSFYGCEKLTQIEIDNTNNLSYIGDKAFYKTSFYNDQTNWENGALFLHDCLIKLDSDTKIFLPNKKIKLYAENSLSECYYLETIRVSGDYPYLLANCTNLKNLIIDDMPSHKIYLYFRSVNNIPITLTNIIIEKSCQINNNNFLKYIHDVNIFVEHKKLAVGWDYFYKGWNNGNKVYYGDEWIETVFYKNDFMLEIGYYIKNTIIRQPLIRCFMEGFYKYEFIGWDIDNDGVPDSYPASSNNDIIAKALYKKECITHIYNENVLISTCLQGGYTTYTCIRCNDTYIDNYTNALGHTEVVNVAVAPTCEQTGLTEGKHCSVCNQVLVKQEVINKLGHNYTYSFVWDTTKSSFNVICLNDSNHNQTLTPNVLKTIIKEATKTEEGIIEYTASITFDGKLYSDKIQKSYALFITGDLDGNDEINTDDVTYLLMNSYFPEDYPITQECDYNNDNIVNTDDVTYLLMHIYFPNEYPLEK